MRTCGNCVWGEQPSTGAGYICDASGERRRVFGYACATWKPEQDWRDETCGTCEFSEDSGCWCGPGKAGNTNEHACSKWMPKEE